MVAAPVQGRKAVISTNVNGSGRIQEVAEIPQIHPYVMWSRSNNTWLLDGGVLCHSRDVCSDLKLGCYWERGTKDL